MKQKMYYGKIYRSYRELESAITNYIRYYNKERIKEKLNWRSPVEYRKTQAAYGLALRQLTREISIECTYLSGPTFWGHSRRSVAAFFRSKLLFYFASKVLCHGGKQDLLQGIQLPPGFINGPVSCYGHFGSNIGKIP